jgi:uncharacterized membrane protein
MNADRLDSDTVFLPSPKPHPVAAILRRPAFWAWVFMLAFAIWFSTYSIRLHDAHLTYKSDLGQMDLAIWNTAHGRFVQEMKGASISTRLTDHVEPIFLPVSALFWLWDDARALLVLQAAALALGAWPIFLLARRNLAASAAAPSERLAETAGLAFVVAYLLTPALQAPAAAEFHALPLAVPCIAWALWAVEDRRWFQFSAAAILVMSVQEGMALVAAALGLYAAAREIGRGRAKSGAPAGSVRHRNTAGAAVGVAISVLGLAWFYVTTFVIIPHYAQLAYGIGQTPYAARFGELGDSFGGVIRSLVTRPLTVLRIVSEPLRLRYLFGLLIPTAFFGLFGAEILLISLPLLLANLLNTFPMQYSGELHYSAPLVPVFTFAAVVGLARLTGNYTLWREGVTVNKRRISGLTLASILVIGCALGYQIASGYTPIGGEFRRSQPGGWPQVTAHHRLLDRFAAQIPPGAPLSVATDLYPHLDHRELVYEFPILGQAQWALVDVSGTTDQHPADVQAAIRKLMAEGWGVVDAADGYILLAQGRGAAEIPDSFYDFVRVPAGEAGQGDVMEPQYPLDITFGDRLRLLGYDIVDNAKWRRTGFRFYWQPLAPLPADTALSMQVVTPDGEAADDTALRPMPSLLWYPPARWQPGESILTTSVPWYLPRAWAPVLTVTAGGQPLYPQINATASADPPDRPALAAVDGRLQLPAWERRDARLRPFERPSDPGADVTAHFAGEDWQVGLVQWSAPIAVAPGGKLPVSLHWRSAGPAPQDYNIFVHLRDASGQTVATGDAAPNWFVPQPTSRWSGGDPGVWTAHLLNLPENLASGRYDLVVGWYDWQTGQRLPLADSPGNLSGDEFVLGPVTVDRAVGRASDITCLMVQESCASQE